VLVTGGTGYLGQAVVRALAIHGHEPVVFARGAERSELPGRLINGDIRDRGAVDRAATGCEAICHMAALVSLWRRRARDFDDVNVGGLRNVLDVAVSRGVRRLVYTSSFLALPPGDGAAPLRTNDYQRTKMEAERIAAEAASAGAPLVRLYPGVVYGPGKMTEGNLVGRLLADYVHGRLPGLIGADRIWSFSYVNDVAAGHVAALERGRIGAQYRLGGENLPQVRPFQLVHERTGRALPRRLPYPMATAIGFVEEARVRLLGGTPKLTRSTVDIFRHDWPLDSSEAVRDLGYTITPLREGIARTMDWA
jgi:farnesol dehydrogenase